MYKKCEHIHFMGIGGIGMSGIAEILTLSGYTVSGCDTATQSKTLDHLQAIGCQINYNHDSLHTHNADVLVYTAAVKKNHPEIEAALKKGIPVIPRAIMLAELMRTKYSVAVSGSHGKTTTTSLISHIMVEASKNPTVIVGGVLKNIATNARLGESDLLIAEACESDRSLLYLNPTMAVLTNIDAEHLDTYKDLDDVKNTFKDFLARLPFYGKAFVCIDDTNVRSILPMPHIRTVKYGLSKDAEIMAANLQLKAKKSILDVYRRQTPDSTPILLGSMTVNLPGHHNALNALAATALCLEFDVPFSTIANALASFGGVERRFELKGTFKGAEIFDDYGHHPTEINYTLDVARRRAAKKLHVIFQPHRFSRTQKLWDNFVDTFSRNEIDTLFVTHIYGASEDPIEGITGKKLVDAIKTKNPKLNIIYCETYSEITLLAENILNKGDLLLTLGAGKVNKVGEDLVNKHR